MRSGATGGVWNGVALLTTALAGLGLALALINAGLAYNNRVAQAALAQRAEFVAQTGQVVRAGQIVVQALAEAAQHDGGTAIRDLLSANGVTLRPTPAAADR